MNVKDGYKTTEFWLTLISLIISGVVSLGLIPAEQGEQLSNGLAQLVAAVFMLLPVAVYVWGRSKVKSSN